MSVRSALPFDLCAMHHAARLWVEGLTPVHGRAIIPEQEITHHLCTT
jgi:hypothetical protein